MTDAAPAARGRGAAFLDRDGTLIRDVHYLSDPALAKLLPGAANAVRRLNEAGWPVVVVTNQSGVARGYFTMAEYERVERRVNQLIEEGGGFVDATYVCPHHPDFTGPCECRKPGTLLFRQASEALDLDLAASWYVGDKLRDVSPATTLGGRGILVASDHTPAEEIASARAHFLVTGTLDEAVDRIIESAR